MNKRQATRIALATEASYILLGATTDGITDFLSEPDAHRFRDAQQEIAWQMLRRAGHVGPMNAHEILAAVLGGSFEQYSYKVDINY